MCTFEQYRTVYDKRYEAISARKIGKYISTNFKRLTSTCSTSSSKWPSYATLSRIIKGAAGLSG